MGRDERMEFKVTLEDMLVSIPLHILQEIYKAQVHNSGDAAYLT